MASCGGPDDLGGLGDKVRIVGLAPRLARRQVDLVLAQEAPDVLVRHVDQLPRQQRRRPAAVAGRRRLIEQRQDPLVSVSRVTRCRARPRQVVQSAQALARKARAPSADPPRPGPQLGGDRAGRAALRRQQRDTGPLDNPVFSLRRSNHRFKRRPFLLRQGDRRRFLDVHSILESRLRLQR